jgi:hypothetical protein
VTSRDLNTLNSLVTYAVENMPGGADEDEEVVARVVGIWARDGIPITQVCPHCGQPAPAGPDRLRWLEHHVDSQIHRVWCDMHNRLLELRERFAR